MVDAAPSSVAAVSASMREPLSGNRFLNSAKRPRLNRTFVSFAEPSLVTESERPLLNMHDKMTDAERDTMRSSIWYTVSAVNGNARFMEHEPSIQVRRCAANLCR
jgi:hypothetical protein